MHALQSWVDATISATVATGAVTTHMNPTNGHVPFSVVLTPFVGTYCIESNWPYGELWLVDSVARRATLSTCVMNTENKHIAGQLGAFAAASRAIAAPSIALKNGMLFRAMSSCAAEWVDEVGMRNGQFDRTVLATRHGLKACQVMPVKIFAGQCVAVLVFADVERRAFEVSAMEKLREHVAIIAHRYSLFLYNSEATAAKAIQTRRSVVMDAVQEAATIPIQCRAHPTSTARAGGKVEVETPPLTPTPVGSHTRAAVRRFHATARVPVPVPQALSPPIRSQTDGQATLHYGNR